MRPLGFLFSDASFRERAAAITNGVDLGDLPPIDIPLGHLRTFTNVRRREVRVARLEKANRASAAKWRSDGNQLAEATAAFAAAIATLSGAAQALRPLITPALDDVMALAADEDHPLRKALYETLHAFGAADDEIGWLFAELAPVGFRLVQLVCADGFEDILVLLQAASIGEAGVLLAGFPRFTGDAQVDERLGRLVLRLRASDITASIYLVLTIVMTAHFAASQRGSRNMSLSAPAAHDARALQAMMRGVQGQAIEPPPAVRLAMAAQRNTIALRKARSRSRAPEWFQRLAEQGADPAAIVKAATARALEKRDDATLLEVKAVLNELSHEPRAAAAILEVITVETLGHLSNRS